MADEINGNQKNRLDRVEDLLNVLVNDHIQFRDEHRQLLKSQVLLYDTVQKLTEAQTASELRMATLATAQATLATAQATLATAQATLATAQAQLAGAQQHIDEKLAALIDIVDSLIRRTPPPPS